jgi:pyridoxamine 5'-phosphate oxidase
MPPMADPRSIGAPGRSHDDHPLSADELDADPIAQFQRWFDEATETGIALPHAMALATADAAGTPSVRHVLLRGIDRRGFVFYTNRESRKGRELAVNLRAALVFFWASLDRQVSARGSVEPVSDEESDAYFASRPRDAQIGAWASRQSEPLDGRETLDALVREAEERHAGAEVPRPPYWGGYRVVPDEVEFWQGRRHRLHDRFLYRRGGDGWSIRRLSP